MNILGGVLPADRGEIVIDGAAVHFRTPSDSLSAGVAFIHQELSLINDLAIYENMFIGRELKTKYGLLDAKTMIQKTQEVFDRLELHLDPRTMVRELDASYKQIVEISRAMMMEASLIIMDEPTTWLDVRHQLEVMRTARALAENGRAVVLVSHNLCQSLRVAGRVALLAEGRLQQLSAPEALYESGALDRAFGVRVRRVETEGGWQYYCEEPPEGGVHNG